MCSATEPRRFRTLVLDDDPTGTQCAAGVAVLLRPPAGVAEFAAGSEPAAFALTNTRALPRDAAVELVRQLNSIVAARADQDVDVVLVQRGDSTMRGHVLAEMLAQGLDDGAGLFVPAFPDAGRVTLGGVHHLRGPAGLQNVADTEFAADPVFAYRGRTVAEWVAEQDPTRAVVLVPRAASGLNGEAVCRALVAAPAGAIVVPDVADNADIAAIAAGFRSARVERPGIVVRSAAPLAAAIAGCPGHRVGPPAVAGPILVVCGSHTAAATRQLGLLDPPAPPVVVPAGELDPAAEQAVLAECAARLTADLRAHGLAVVMSERERRTEHGSLDHGAVVMRRLTTLVAALRPELRAVISKGGITSADIATVGLDATRAEVIGQLETGISLWSLRVAGRDVPYVVVPGNVGDDGTLSRLVDALSTPSAAVGSTARSPQC